MQWYYSANGQQQGPVSQDVLESLAKAGTITRETLVWREGMANWAPYSSISGAVAGNLATVAATAGDPNKVRCAECGLTFQKDDMVVYAGSHICATCKPVFFQKLKEGVEPGASGLWRYKKQLVTTLNPVLPTRCVKCNVPMEGPRKKVALSWFHPLAYLGLAGGLLPFVVIAMVMQKRTMAAASVCQEHAAKRRNAIIVAWLLVLGGIGLFILGLANDFGWVAGLGGISFLAGIIYGIVKGRLIYATKINKQNAWMGGCGKEFLAQFPEWTGS